MKGVDEGAYRCLGRNAGSYHSLIILESIQRMTMTLKEKGESYEGLPGLSRTIPSAFLREGG